MERGNEEFLELKDEEFIEVEDEGVSSEELFQVTVVSESVDGDDVRQPDDQEASEDDDSNVSDYWEVLVQSINTLEWCYACGGDYPDDEYEFLDYYYELLDNCQSIQDLEYPTPNPYNLVKPITHLDAASTILQRWSLLPEKCQQLRNEYNDLLLGGNVPWSTIVTGSQESINPSLESKELIKDIDNVIRNSMVECTSEFKYLLKCLDQEINGSVNNNSKYEGQSKISLFGSVKDNYDCLRPKNTLRYKTLSLNDKETYNPLQNVLKQLLSLDLPESHDVMVYQMFLELPKVQSPAPSSPESVPTSREDTEQATSSQVAEQASGAAPSPPQHSNQTYSTESSLSPPTHDLNTDLQQNVGSMFLPVQPHYNPMLHSLSQMQTNEQNASLFPPEYYDPQSALSYAYAYDHAAMQGACSQQYLEGVSIQAPEPHLAQAPGVQYTPEGHAAMQFPTPSWEMGSEYSNPRHAYLPQRRIAPSFQRSSEHPVQRLPNRLGSEINTRDYHMSQFVTVEQWEMDNAAASYREMQKAPSSLNSDSKEDQVQNPTTSQNPVEQAYRGTYSGNQPSSFTPTTHNQHSAQVNSSNMSWRNQNVPHYPNQRPHTLPRFTNQPPSQFQQSQTYGIQRPSALSQASTYCDTPTLQSQGTHRSFFPHERSTTRQAGMQAPYLSQGGQWYQEDSSSSIWYNPVQNHQSYAPYHMGTQNYDSTQNSFRHQQVPSQNYPMNQVYPPSHPRMQMYRSTQRQTHSQTHVSQNQMIDPTYPHHCLETQMPNSSPSTVEHQSDLSQRQATEEHPQRENPGVEFRREPRAVSCQEPGTVSCQESGAVSCQNPKTVSCQEPGTVSHKEPGAVSHKETGAVSQKESGAASCEDPSSDRAEFESMASSFSELLATARQVAVTESLRSVTPECTLSTTGATGESGRSTPDIFSYDGDRRNSSHNMSLDEAAKLADETVASRAREYEARAEYQRADQRFKEEAAAWAARKAADSARARAAAASAGASNFSPDDPSDDKRNELPVAWNLDSAHAAPPRSIFGDVPPHLVSTLFQQKVKIPKDSTVWKLCQNIMNSYDKKCPHCHTFPCSCTSESE